jgi:hypothetical protein
MKWLNYKHIGDEIGIVMHDCLMRIYQLLVLGNILVKKYLKGSKNKKVRIYLKNQVNQNQMIKWSEMWLIN